MSVSQAPFKKRRFTSVLGNTKPALAINAEKLKACVHRAANLFLQRTLRYLVLAGCAVINIPISSANTELDDAIAKVLADRVALSVILSDSDALAFGVSDFDPNTIFGTDIDNLGDDGTVAARRSKSAYVLPYSHEIKNSNGLGAHVLSATGYYIDSNSKLSIDTTVSIEDEFNEQSYGVMLGYAYKKMLNERLSLSGGLQMHVMRYQNQFVANNIISEVFKQVYKGSLVDTFAWSAIFAPQLELEYIQPQTWGRFELSSKVNYFTGYTWGDANIGNPSGHYFTNQIFAYYDIFDKSQTLFTGAKRVDVSDSIRSGLGSSFYYEASFGWLYNQPSRYEWLENIGVGLNFNYGSSLRGGSIMLYFNK